MSPVHYVNIQKQQLNINSNNKNNCADYALEKFKNSKIQKFADLCMIAHACYFRISKSLAQVYTDIY